MGTKRCSSRTRALDPLYNPDVLLHAFSILRRRLPGVRLVLKHPGTSLPATVAARLRELRLEEVTVVVGFVDEDELADLYRAADAYISIPSSDSSPRSVWEALACETATAVSDLPWARESLRDGEHALLIPVNAGDAALALEKLLTNPEAAARLATRGRTLAVATMDRADQIAKVDSL